MPFDLIKYPNVFSRVINEMFCGQTCSSLPGWHLQFFKTSFSAFFCIRNVLKCLGKQKLYDTLEKWAFDLAALEHFYCQLSREVVQMDPAKVQSILIWQAYRKVKNLQLSGFLPTFTHDSWLIFVKCANWLTQLQKKGCQFNWPTQEEITFQDLNLLFSSSLCGIIWLPVNPFCANWCIKFCFGWCSVALCNLFQTPASWMELDLQ